MAALAAPPPAAADQQLLEDALGRALDAGKTGPELLSALHAAAPHLEMAAMHSLLEDYKAKEDAKACMKPCKPATARSDDVASPLQRRRQGGRIHTGRTCKGS